MDDCVAKTLYRFNSLRVSVLIMCPLGLPAVAAALLVTSTFGLALARSAWRLRLGLGGQVLRL